MKTIAFITLGCKTNQYETNAMMQQMLAHGYTIVEPETEADVYVINTCTVTHIADRKSRQMMRRVKEAHPQSIVVACGCYAQVAKETLQELRNRYFIRKQRKKSISHLHRKLC